MSREIKFRAWDVLYKKYHYNVESTNGYGDTFFQSFQDYLNSITTFVVEQFTGLYDKNNVPIYEGDIVKVDESDVFSSVIGVFVFERSSFVIKTPYFMFFGKVPKEREMEIIGNIHENEELLEREEQ